MEKPKTNRDAFKLVLETVGSKTALANGLGVAKQLTSRWHEIPVKHLEATCKVTRLPPDYVLPEMDEQVSAILANSRNWSPAIVLFNLIRVILQPKANPWHARKKRKPRKS